MEEINVGMQKLNRLDIWLKSNKKNLTIIHVSSVKKKIADRIFDDKNTKWRLIV